MVISTAQTDLGLRSRTFSLKINELSTFSEIIQALQAFTYSISTSNYVLNPRYMYRPHYAKYKDLYYTPQNHSTVTT